MLLLKIALVASILFNVQVAYSLDDNRRDKIAFLFLSRGSIPLEAVWREFFRWRADSHHYNVYAHPHANFAFPPGSLFYKKEVRSEPTVKWGGMSQVRAIKSLVRAALEDPDNQWFCLMSESCIPLVPFQKWRNALLGFNKSVTNACAMSAGEMETHTRWRPSLDAVGLNKSHWRKSATWFALKRKHALIFVNETKTEPGWDGVPCCDEHYLPTILAYYGQDNETTCSDGFVHVSWPSLIAAHPRTYSGDDITPQLFSNLKKPVGDHPGFGMQCSGVPELCHFTARKFAPNTKFPLMEHIDMILDEEDHPYTGNPWDHHVDKLRVNTTDGSYFLVEDGKLRMVPDNITMKYMHLSTDNIKPLSSIDLTDYEIGLPIPSRHDGIAVKTAKQRQIYLLVRGHRRIIPNWDTFLYMGFHLDNVTLISENDLGQIPLGEPMPHLLAPMDITKILKPV